MNAHTPILKPYGMPEGMDPQQWRQSVEKRLNDLLDRAMALITVLDLMEADCDLEDTADAEPWLGWSGYGRGYQEGEGMDDRELDDERQADDGDYDFPGFIWGGGEDGH